MKRGLLPAFLYLIFTQLSTHSNSINPGNVLQIKSVNSGMNIGIDRKDLGTGGQIRQLKPAIAKTQFWILEKAEDGYFYIRNYQSGQYFTIENGNTNKGGHLVHAPKSGGPEQMFRFSPVKNLTGTYYIVARHSGLVIDVYSYSKYSGAKIHQWPLKKTDNQKWRIKWIKDPERALKPWYGNFTGSNLKDKLQSVEIDLSPAIIKQSSRFNWPWPSVVMAAVNDGTFMLAYMTYDGKDNDIADIHILRLSNDFKQIGQETVIKNRLLAGLAAHDDGFAVLAATKLHHIGNGYPAHYHHAKLFIVGFAKSGQKKFETILIGNEKRLKHLSRFLPMSFSSSRLAFDNNQYIAFFGHQQQFSKTEKDNSHELDSLIYVSPEGMVIRDKDHTASHSLNQRLIAEDGEVYTLTVGHNSGYWLQMNKYKGARVFAEKFHRFSGKQYQLGGFAKSANTLLILGTGINGKFHDLLLHRFDTTGKSLGQAFLLETGSLPESNAKISPLGENLLIGYEIKGDHALALVNSQGTIIEQPNRVKAQWYANDDFITTSRGHVVWACKSDQSRITIYRVQK